MAQTTADTRAAHWADVTDVATVASWAGPLVARTADRRAAWWVDVMVVVKADLRAALTVGW